MKNETPAERIVALVDTMRYNSQEMRMWKNIPLAKECVELLRKIDDSEESPLGKALACEAICEQLPEYDVPRYVLSIRHYELSLLEQSDEKSRNLSPEGVRSDIQRMEDYIDTERMSVDEFMEKYQRYLRFDPVERTPQWEEAYYDAELECDRRLGDIPRGMGFCFSYWSTIREVLAERGIQWHSPHELNPGVMFD